MINALESLGLTRIESELYVCIAKNCGITLMELDSQVNYSKEQTAKGLESLISKTLVTTKNSSFFALPFEETLELLIKKQREEQHSIEKSEKSLAN